MSDGQLIVPGRAEGEAAAPRVAGIDPSMTGTGIATDEGTWTVKTAEKDGDRRLLHIRTAIVELILGPPGHYTGLRVDLAVLEDLPKHAMSAGITGMAQGVIRATLHEYGVPYVTVIPSTLKVYATGRGTADKRVMSVEAMKRAQAEFPDDNQADAWWLRLMGLDGLGHPELDLPATHRRALAKVAWPKLATL